MPSNQPLAFGEWELSLCSVSCWTGSLAPGGWMAWTFPTALFFWVIAALLLGGNEPMSVGALFIALVTQLVSAAT